LTITNSPKAKPEEESAREIATVNRIPLQQKAQAAGDDYYQSVVIETLLRVLKDHSSSVSDKHHHAIDAIMSIFKIQGLRSVAHLTQVCVMATT
jgi:FKBP12-rapamycin complex-associated protein